MVKSVKSLTEEEIVASISLTCIYGVAFVWCCFCVLLLLCAVAYLLLLSATSTTSARLLLNFFIAKTAYKI